ncbi:MAG: signal peptidase I [Euryarchaeota archaeon]|nr:signal peptidase I [Euryarchaeota archaeon]
MKKKLTMKSLIGNLIFISVFLLIFTRILSVWSGIAFPINLISAGSMTPSLMEGDIIAWTPVDIEKIEVGDVIVFKSWLSWPDERHVVHRVTEIKDVFGRPAFVTKGDANEYTDQAGPHVVEPYVTEKNFVGKTISIGKQPLKIPLVGLIGIWANDGLKALASPTESKGSLTYIGVFTPLTIAIILLVISFVVLPEKAKTVKEKLRRYIFGSRTIDAKKTFVTFLVLYIVLLSFIHCFAFDSTPASLGIQEFPENSSFELGSVSPGSTTNPKNLPAVNPGIFPVKGIILGSGELTPFVNKAIFSLNSGENKEVIVTATASNASKNGTYAGNIMMYSSPLWFMFPDEVFLNIYFINAEGTVLIFDVLAACILTIVTTALIVSAEFFLKVYNTWDINYCWQHARKLFFKKSLTQRVRQMEIKQRMGKNLGWFMNLNLGEIDLKKPILGSLVLIPIFLLISSEILAMCIASITAGLVAFFISCKLRNKIVLASIIPLFTVTVFVLLKTNFYLFTSSRTTLQSLTLGIGAVSVYILVLSFLLIPISLISWYLTHLIRNLKERKDPLLILEGRCDL